jgi:hypothetical protein
MSPASEQPAAKPVVPWINLLSRSRTFCSICYHQAQEAWVAETKAGIPHPPERQPWVRIVDPAWFAAGINPINPRTKAAYQTKLRAAFFRHLVAVHPDLPFEVR